MEKIPNAGRRLTVMARAERMLDLIRVNGWGPELDKAYADLIKEAAEESCIVKAARVLVRSHFDLLKPGVLTEEQHADFALLYNQIAWAGAPPYEQGTGTAAEDDWVAPLREELRKYNR